MPEILNMIQNSLPEFSLAGLFFLFFFGTFLSEDAACLLAGSMAASGRVGYAVPQSIRSDRKQFAASTLPTLEQHKEMAHSLHEN